MCSTGEGMRISILEKVVEQKVRQKSEPTILKSHIEGTDHHSGITTQIRVLERVGARMALLEGIESDDPWQVSELDEEYLALKWEFTNAAGIIHAHLSYMDSADGIEVPEHVVTRIREVCPGILTSHWQMLVKGDWE